MSATLRNRPGLAGTFIAGILCLAAAAPTAAQSFRVQCPNSTNLHPLVNSSGASGAKDSTLPNPQIKCQQVSGGDGYATMADGNQIYLFGFGPLSGLQSMQDKGGINNLINGDYVGTQRAAEFNKQYTGPIIAGGTGAAASTATTSPDAGITEPAEIMNIGVMAANIPAPLIAVDEDDELFLTLSNVGMIMRPDLFEQHTIHWHGYPNASSYFDGVPDASVAINIAGSFTYYYSAPDAGTYFWHCHITPPEHLQMGMVGQLYVRPRQNRLPVGASLYAALNNYEYPAAPVTAPPAGTVTAYPGTPAVSENAAGNCDIDILCSTPVPQPNAAVQTPGAKYAYDDGDASTRYDVEYPIQIHGFDPNFHFIGMTFNPEPFANMKDKYFLLNGRSYPDTANPVVQSTAGSDGVSRPSQPMNALITIPHGGRALLRISDLAVTEYSTLGTIGIPMTVIGFHARMLRDMAGNNMSYQTNSITIGGGESLDVILDASDPAYASCSASAPCTFFLYSTNLDHLSNDAENFGGMMTEIKVL